MSVEIRVQVKGQPKTLTLDKDPDTCPMCHRGVKPNPADNHYIPAGERSLGERLQRVFICPREQCQNLFIASYYPHIHTSMLFLSSCLPMSSTTREFGEIIVAVSQDFIKIYNQAHTADERDLKLICGPGYRKALEFLIKDYCMRLTEAQETKERIKKMNLGECIREFVTNEQVKFVSARAVWLGNDETHYTRKWEDKDLDNLKELIELTIHWIEMEELTSKLKTHMPEPKK